MSRIKHLILLIMIAAAWLSAGQRALCADNGTLEGSFKEANEKYKQNDHEAAIAAYERLIENGQASGNVYYNLGNAYFKKGEIGKALVSYERARLFMPQDSDVKSNYEFVLGALNAGHRYDGGNFLIRSVDRVYDGWGIDALTIMVSLLWLSLLVSLTLYRFIPAAKKALNAAVMIFTAFMLVSGLGLSRKIYFLEHGAVVITKAAEARFEPALTATTHYKLAEGSFVTVLDSSSEWLKVRRQDDKIGWVLKDSVWPVDPDKVFKQ